MEERKVSVSLSLYDPQSKEQNKWSSYLSPLSLLRVVSLGLTCLD